LIAATVSRGNRVRSLCGSRGWLKRAKIRIRFHDLRHSYATLTLTSGVDLKTVSMALGHSTISTSGNTYLHAVESLQSESAARIDALLGDSITAGLRAKDDVHVNSGPQQTHTVSSMGKKTRGSGLSVVAPTGIEPVFPP